MYGGFLVTEAGLRSAASIAQRGDSDRVFEYLEENTEVLRPEYTYPPFVLSLAVDYLKGTVAGFRVPDRSEVREAMEAADVAVPLFATPAAAGELLPALASFSANDAAFAKFFEEAVGEPWESAPAALQEALAYVRSGLLAAQEKGLSFVVLVS